MTIVPESFRTRTVPLLFAAEIVTVIWVVLFTVKLVTGERGPIFTELIPTNPVPVITIVAPAAALSVERLVIVMESMALMMTAGAATRTIVGPLPLAAATKLEMYFWNVTTTVGAAAA